MSFSGEDDTQTWILHNPIRPWTLAHLSAREARLVVETLSAIERNSLLVTTTGKDSWYKLESSFCQPLTAVLKEFQADKKLPAFPISQEQELTTVHLLGRMKEFRDRKFERVFVSVPIEVIAGGKCFATISEDLSEGGIRVKDLLPDYVAGYFAVVVKPEGAKFEVHCSIVEDQKKDRYRIEIVSIDSDPQFVAYSQWVNAQRTHS